MNDAQVLIHRVNWIYSMEGYTEGCHPRKTLFAGTAFSTNVTLGRLLPSMFCVVNLPNRNMNKAEYYSLQTATPQ